MGLYVNSVVFYFNPRAPRGARRGEQYDIRVIKRISIHVPREGHDFQFLRNIAVFAISIHVPREGHDAAR